jgi:flavin reductase (DIM6/NTAB) family NADH-FMN oxidoreductase RutF
MATINPKEVSVPQFHAWLLSAVVPRPIAFASTINKKGEVNLSPFSFFNCFGANPPLLIFSPARRGRDNTTKHTYENVIEVPEVVINVVNYPMVQQASLASTEYPKGVNEFKKAGFTEVPSVMVKPPRVAESPVAMECKVLQVIQTGTGGAAGNLVICQVLLMHVKDEVLDGTGSIDPFKLDAVARLGREWYCRVQGDSIFKVPRPTDKIAVGIDQLPAQVRNSTVLTGNDLGLLATVEKIPDVRSDLLPSQNQEALHQRAQVLLREGRIADAWKALGYG